MESFPIYEAIFKYFHSTVFWCGIFRSHAKVSKTVNLGNLFWRDVMCVHGPPSCVRRKGGVGVRREGRGAGPERSGGGRRQEDRLAAGVLNLTDGEG